ncbi:hypothetical protein [Orbus mooreae]|uniref:hypothetical protein n=1 Tax=Orbus mooreae TaxID=3074107 RepID=UPI00370D18C9
MRNVIIKKIALGMLLAGCAASSAFALPSATTTTIKGNAPTISSTASTPTAGKVSYIVQRNDSGTWKDISTYTEATDKRVRAGDRVVISFKYADTDGDESYPDWTKPASGDPQNANPFVVYVPEASGNAKITIPANTDYSNVKLGTAGQYTYVIPAEASGRTLAISLTPMSQYGDPWKGTTIEGNLFATTSGGSGGGTGEGSTPETCETNPDTCIQPNINNLKVQIVHTTNNLIYGSSTTSDVNATDNPKIGDTFKYVVIDTGNANKDVTANYDGAWSYAGKNTPAASAATAQDPVANSITSATYTIGVNSLDELTLAAKNASTNYYAGGQGFQLQVTIAEK